jgi:hypothetical protein
MSKTLLDICVEFILKHQIRCAESVYQEEEVALNALELIEEICENIGYCEDLECEP